MYHIHPYLYVFRKGIFIDSSNNNKMHLERAEHSTGCDSRVNMLKQKLIADIQKQNFYIKTMLEIAIIKRKLIFVVFVHLV